MIGVFTMLDPKNYEMKKYIHFDRRVRIEQVESYVTNPKKIARHSFLPFIYFQTIHEKLISKKNPDLDNRPIAEKTRDIMYASHLDNFIYKFYSEELNENYNDWCIEHGIDDCSTAYRNNKKRHSNIEFSAEIIASLVEYKEAFVMVGDFTKYFDNLDHKILKKNLLEVLNCNFIEDDWYNVYRSITRYGYYDKTYLIAEFGTDNELKSKKKFQYFSSVKEFRKFQNEVRTKKNANRYGIPQGAAISAVLANVYAIDFDTAMEEIASKYRGLYRRYSDDFIIIVPKQQKEQKLTVEEFKELELRARKLAEVNKIEIQEDKTKLFKYSQDKIFDLEDNEATQLDYLGFVFDGKNVRMRGKSAYKFYRKAYQIIDKAKKVKEKKDLEHLPYKKHIYGLYTDLGIERNQFGNFISYAMRAQDSFDLRSPNTNNLMMEQIKNRKRKIEKRLGIKIHTKVQP